MIKTSEIIPASVPLDQLGETEARDVATQFVVKTIVMQTGTLCNLDCKYCYLPHRMRNKKMPPLLASRVSDCLATLPGADWPIHIVWHAGEPLAVGVSYLEELLQPFAELEHRGAITHVIQTNATLLNARWCALLATHNVRVGVSIDGPAWATTQRVDWTGTEAYPRILRGIELLKEHALPFSVIAVVGATSIQRAQELYSFFADLGCGSLGINIEEWEGKRRGREIIDDDRVEQFWEELFLAWRANPTLRIREFDRVLNYMDAVCNERISSATPTSPQVIDILPTVGWNGEVSVLTPELHDVCSEKYENFVVGNILTTPLGDVLKRAERALYMRDYLSGVAACMHSCRYFSFCRGGQASNKFFEFGSTNGGCTSFCRNTRQRLLEAVLRHI